MLFVPSKASEELVLDPFRPSAFTYVTIKKVLSKDCDNSDDDHKNGGASYDEFAIWFYTITFFCDDTEYEDHIYNDCYSDNEKV